VIREKSMGTIPSGGVHSRAWVSSRSVEGQEQEEITKRRLVIATAFDA